MLLNSKLKCLYFAKSGQLIVPGNNVFTGQDAEDVKSSPDVVEKVKLDIFIIKDVDEIEEKIGDEVLSNEEKSAKVVAAYPEPTALSTVKELLDLRVLLSIKKIEVRQSVLKAVNEKIEEITKKPKGELGNDGDNF